MFYKIVQYICVYMLFMYPFTTAMTQWTYTPQEQDWTSSQNPAAWQDINWAH